MIVVENMVKIGTSFDQNSPKIVNIDQQVIFAVTLGALATQHFFTFISKYLIQQQVL